MKKFLAGASLCVGLLAPVFAGTHKVPPGEPIVTVEVPDKWKTTERGEHIEAISPDGAVSFLVMPAEAKKINEAMGEAMRYLRNKDAITVRADSMQREAGQLNGMDVKNVSWLGKNQKGDVKINFKIMSIPEGKPVIVVYWASPDAEKKHQKELNKMLQSITRI
jgi:tRNA U34 2-thiouridine synthase MnmA/TrmU